MKCVYSNDVMMTKLMMAKVYGPQTLMGLRTLPRTLPVAYLTSAHQRIMALF